MNGREQRYLERVDVREACQEHHTVLRTGLWQAPVGYTGLVTAQDSPGDWKLDAVEVGIGFLPLVNLIHGYKMLKYGWYLGRGKA